jgi:ssDNA-specific exonuclease RecJ
MDRLRNNAELFSKLSNISLAKQERKYYNKIFLDTQVIRIYAMNAAALNHFICALPHLQIFQWLYSPSFYSV